MMSVWLCIPMYNMTDQVTGEENTGGASRQWSGAGHTCVSCPTLHMVSTYSALSSLQYHERIK